MKTADRRSVIEMHDAMVARCDRELERGQSDRQF